MNATTPIEDQAVSVWNETLTLHFKVSGSGDPIIYFHPAGGLAWDGYLSALARDYTVYAPEIPGTSAGDSFAIHKVDDLDDLVLIYEEAIRELDLESAPIAIGQSFGGMIALELAARYPDMFQRVIVSDPLGLWREDLPTAPYLELPPEKLPGVLFADPTGPAATAMLTPPEDLDEAIAVRAGRVWALGCTGKFAWPFPEKGLSKRLHRIQVPTLIVWGEQDKLVPVEYGADFADAIAGSRLEIIPDCGHIPQVEQTDRMLELVREFLDTTTAPAAHVG